MGILERVPEYVTDQIRDSEGRESAIVGAKIEHSPVSALSRKRNTRLRTADENGLPRRRQILDQKTHDIMDCRIGDCMIVVEIEINVGRVVRSGWDGRSVMATSIGATNARAVASELV